jgi:hypothetical protein
MTHLKRFLFVIPVILLFPGCASIVSKSSWPFSVMTEPDGARVSITNKRGREVFRGKTPVAMKLKSGAGFFAKESYTITLEMKGYETKKVNVECKLNGWYFGNIVIGGLLGFLIIDPATGAMYKLEHDGIIETLDRSDAGNASLRILDKNQLNEKQLQKLVRIN